MSRSLHTLPAPVGGRLMTGPFRLLLAVVAVGAVVTLVRYLFGLGSVSNLSDGYPWGIWIAFDVVVGTALGCGGYAVALLVYILNKGEYHPLVRPAVLTSLLGYGLAVVGVAIDLGRTWELWKVPIFFWRWSGSPQLEVALCVASYVAVLMVEMSPALFERWRQGGTAGQRVWATRGLRWIDRGLPFLLALGMLLPTMHQSSLGTMMLLPGPRLHALWFTAWLPFLFLVNCLVMGFAIVVLEASFSSRAFGLPRETAMLGRLGRVAAGVSLFWVVFRLGEVAVAGELGLLASAYGAAFGAEVLLHVAGAAMLLGAAGRTATGQARAGLLLVLAGVLFRIDTYLVAFQPGSHFRYFPALPELLITFAIIALEIVLYLWAVKRLPILAGKPASAAVSTPTMRPAPAR
jgi:Ni/Fe-hydrogenase subunit HybB-like protein